VLKKDDDGYYANITFPKGATTFVVAERSLSLLKTILKDAKGDIGDAYLSAQELNSIDGVSGAIEGFEEHYQEYINRHPDDFSDPIKYSEVQKMIDRVNNGSFQKTVGNPSINFFLCFH
jgi:hypothetical protein